MRSMLCSIAMGCSVGDETRAVQIGTRQTLDEKDTTAFPTDRTRLMVLMPRFLQSAISCLPSTLFAAFCSRYSPSGTFVSCGKHTTHSLHSRGNEADP